MGAQPDGTLRLWCLRMSAAVLAAGLAVFCLAAAPDEDGISNTPIIAQILARPGVYEGREVTIYGLVIATHGNGRTFLLQDVSQVPLTVARSDGHVTLMHDQLLVQGKLVAGPNGPRFDATSVTKTTVLGGGGCC